MAKTYERALLDELARIPWLNGPTGQGFVGSVGRAQDAELRALKDGVLMRNPLDAPPDALPYLARDRGILRAPSESDAAFAARLDNAHNIWYWAGSRDGILSVFEPLLLPIPDGFTSATETSPPASPLVRVWDIARLGGAYWHHGSPMAPWYSKCLVVIDSRNGPWTTDGTFADPGTFDAVNLVGSTITVAELQYMRRMIRVLKAPSSYPIHIAVVLEGDAMMGFLPDGQETIGDDTGTFGDTSQVVFLRVGHVEHEAVLWGGYEGTFGDPGVFEAFEE